MKWEENVRKVVPYTPGEQPQDQNVIKLNTNENPYPPAPGVMDRIAELSPERMRLYPAFPEQTQLAWALAEYYQIDREQIFIGVGSDDVLSLAFMTFFQSKRPVLFPDITYSFYDVWADLYRIPYEKKALDEQFAIRPEEYRQPNGGVIFPNPNAPTGVLMELSQVEEIVAANRDVVVIVDEAYIDFGGTSCVELTKQYDNLLVVQTFSKSRSLAGARLGFAIADKGLIADLEKIKYSTNPYNINRLTLAAGEAAVESDAYYRKNAAKIAKTRELTASRLRELGFIVLPSVANFIFVKSDALAGETVYQELKKKGVLVRHFGKQKIKDFVRITIGTPEQMDILLEKLAEILTGQKGA